jgi:hypothetical protein
MEYTKQSKPVTKSSLLFRELDDGAVVYDPESEILHTLNASAAFIWLLCDGHNTISDIINRVKKDFHKLDAVPNKEVNLILNQFQRLDLIEFL